jgi:hypothetical protein
MKHVSSIRRLVAATVLVSVSALNVAAANQTVPLQKPRSATPDAPARVFKQPVKQAPAQVLGKPAQKAPSGLAEVLKRPRSGQRPLGLSSNSDPAKIECCTTWNSSEGTTGCASFEGNTCPAYAPFEAY